MVVADGDSVRIRILPPIHPSLSIIANDKRDFLSPLLLNSSVWVIVSIPPLWTAASFDTMGHSSTLYNPRNRIMILTCAGKTIWVYENGIARCNLAILPVSNYDRTVLLDSYASSVSFVICVYFSDVLTIPVSLVVLDHRIAFNSKLQMTACILEDRRLKSS